MKQCLYCRAEIDDHALKCPHCGEWVVAPQAGESREHRALGSTVGEGLKWYGAFKLGQSAIGVAVLLLILCVIFLPLAAFFFLPLFLFLLHTLMPVIAAVVVIGLMILFFRSLRSRY